MFDNVGSKIKGAAIIIMLINCITSVISGVVVIALAFADIGNLWYLAVAGVILVVMGCLMSWVSAMCMFALGKIEEDVESMKYTLNRNGSTDKMYKYIQNSKNEEKNEIQPKTILKNPKNDEPQENRVMGNIWICGKCKNKNLIANSICWSCKNKK